MSVSSLLDIKSILYDRISMSSIGLAFLFTKFCSLFLS